MDEDFEKRVRRLELLHIYGITALFGVIIIYIIVKK